MEPVNAVVLKAISVLILSLSMAACGSDSSGSSASGDDTNDGGSGGGSTSGGGGSTTSSAPVAPLVTPAYDDWTLTFSWPAVADATFYQVFEDPDGVSGFEQIGPDLTTTNYTNNISVTERNGARYIVAACNSIGCTESSEVTIDALDSGISKIVVSGDSAPGLGGGALFSDALGTEIRFDVNSTGTVAIRGAADQTDSAGSLRDGIFKSTPGAALSLVQADDAQLPNSDATYNGFFDIGIADSGEIIFAGILNQRVVADPDLVSVNAFNSEVLLRNTSGVTSLLAREGDPDNDGTLFPTLDSGPIYFADNAQGRRIFANITVNASGGLTFKPLSNPEAFLNSDDSPYGGPSSFWTFSGGGDLVQSLRAGETALPNNLVPNFFGGTLPFSQNPSGQLAFGLALRNADGTLPPGSSNSGIYVRNVDGSFSEAVRETGGSGRDNIDDLNTATVKIADNGEVFYLAPRDFAGSSNFGLYTNSVDNSDFTRIARKAQPIPLADGTMQEVNDFIGGNGAFDVGPDDSLAFLVNAGDVSQEDALLIWSNDGTSSTTEKVFQEADPVRGLLDASTVDLDAILDSTTTRLRLSRELWAVFVADYEDDSALDGLVLLASSPSGYTRAIVREGQRFAVDGVDYGVVTEILDFEMASPAEMVMSLRFDRDGVFEIGDPPDNKNGVFRVTLCSPSEPC
jgi:hypothetical protein